MDTPWAINLFENELLKNIGYFIENIVSTGRFCCLKTLFDLTWSSLRFKKSIATKV